MHPLAVRFGIVASVCLACAALAVPAAAPVPATPPAYRVAARVALGGSNEWDFIVFDGNLDRAYITHGNQVSVIDGRTGAVLGALAGLHDAHGVAVVPGLHRVYANSGADHMVYGYDDKTFKRGPGISVAADSDAMAFDPASGHVFAFGGESAAASVIDPVANKVIATIPLGGAPEQAVADGKGHLFVNDSTRNRILRIDTASNRITAAWPVPMCGDTHGLAIDVTGSRLFASCKKNNHMIAVAMADGRLLADLPIGAGTDSAGFDPARQRAYSSNKDGTLSVIGAGPGGYRHLGEVKTAPGAKTMAIDPATGRIFLAAGKVVKTVPQGAGEAPDLELAPGSLQALLLDPA